MTWIIAGAMIVGGSAVSAYGFFLNSQTPVQVGPVPVLGGAAVAVIGVMAVVAKAVQQ